MLDKKGRAERLCNIIIAPGQAVSTGFPLPGIYELRNEAPPSSGFPNPVNATSANRLVEEKVPRLRLSLKVHFDLSLTFRHSSATHNGRQTPLFCQHPLAGAHRVTAERSATSIQSIF